MAPEMVFWNYCLYIFTISDICPVREELYAGNVSHADAFFNSR
jgi:hypothetical protein